MWGYEILQVIERIHLKFLKHIFQLKNSTPSYMVYGETGCFPIYINMYSKMISYWVKLLSDDGLKIVNVLYRFLYTQYSNKTFKNPGLNVYKKI
jgi:hypothetical protein